MSLETTDFFIRPEDGWTLVATNPGELLIKPAVYHPWWVAITTTNVAPSGAIVGVPMGRDPSQRNQSYHLVNGATGYVWIRIALPTDSGTAEKMMFSVTTGNTTGGVIVVPSSDVTSGSNTLTLGGAAQTIFSAGQASHGWAVQNQSTDYLYVRQDTTATQDQNSFRISPGSEYVADYVTGGIVSIIGPTTGQAFWARAW